MAEISKLVHYKRVLGSISLSAVLSCAINVSFGESIVFASNQAVVDANNAGVNALNNNNFALAIQKFKEALKIDPNYQRARDNLAITYNNYGLTLQNNPQMAIKQFHQAYYLSPTNSTTVNNLQMVIQMLGKNPNSFKDRMELAKTARLEKDFVGAIVELQEAVKIKPDKDAYEALGDVYRILDSNDLTPGTKDNAIKAYQSAIGLGDSAQLEVKLGQAYQANDDVQNACVAYQKASALNPDDPEIIENLVNGWLAALRGDPVSPNNHIGLGYALQLRGDFDQAAKEYNQALMFAPGNQQAKQLLANLPNAKRVAIMKRHISNGVTFQTNKQYDLAIQEYQQALQADPPATDKSDIWVNIATACRDKGDFDAMIQAAQNAIQFNPKNDKAAEALKIAQESKAEKKLKQDVADASMALKSGQYDLAIQKYKDLITSDPKNAAAHFNLGFAYQAKKDFDNAIAEFRQAVNFDNGKTPDYQKALDLAYAEKAAPLEQQAIAFHKAKNYTGAIDLYQQCLALVPKNDTYWFNLANAFYSNQDYVRAKDAYKKSFELNPKQWTSSIYFIGTIDENFAKGAEALADYKKYLSLAPTGDYAAAAKDRLKALSADITACVKIKSETELALLKQAGDAYDDGVDLQQSGQYDQALAKYQEALKLRPDFPDYVYAMGALFLQRAKVGDADLAINWLQKATQLKPDNKDYKAALNKAFVDKAAPIIDSGVKKQQNGDIAGAIADYLQAVNFVPKNAVLLTNLASAYQANDQFQLARDTYQKAIDTGASDCPKEVLYLLGALDENFNKGSQARDEYQKYVKDAPSGQYVSLANERIKALTINPNAVVKLKTRSEREVAQKYDDAFDAGVKAQEGGQYDQALASYQQALTAKPDSAECMYAIATVYQAMQKLDDSIPWLKKAAAQDKQYQKYVDAVTVAKSDDLLNEAVKKHEAGDIAGAIPLYVQALQMAPKNGAGWKNLATAYQQSDDFAKARDAYQQALTVDSKNQSDCWYFIALLDENFNKGTQAISEYQKYLQMFPKGQYASYCAQRVAALSANPNDTQKMLTQAQQAAAKATQELFDEAVQLQQAGKYDDALTKYMQIWAANQTDANTAYAIGTAQQAKGDLSEAQKWYQTAAKLDPTNEQYRTLAASVKDAQAQPIFDQAIAKHSAGEIGPAIELYLEGLAITPNNAHQWYNLAGAYQAQDNFAKAKEAYLKAVNLDAKNEVDSWYFIASIDENSGFGPQALGEYKKYIQSSGGRGGFSAQANERIAALTANPNATKKLVTAAEQRASADAETAFQDAITKQQAGDYDQAITQYHKALSMSPNQASYLYSLGTCYQAKNDIDNAIAYYQKAVNINGQDASFKKALSDARLVKASPFMDAGYQKITQNPPDYAGAIADYENALRVYDDGNVRLNLGLCYQNTKQEQRAIAEYRKAVTMDKSLVDAYYYAGTAFDALSQAKNAIGEYKKYLQFAPSGGNATVCKERIKVLTPFALKGK